MNQAQQTMEEVTKVMVGEAKVNLMKIVENPELFQRLVNPNTIIDAKISFLTCEGETISVDITDFMELTWNVELVD